MGILISAGGEWLSLSRLAISVALSVFGPAIFLGFDRASNSQSKYIVLSLGRAFYNIFYHPLAGYPGPIPRKGFYFPEFWNVYKGTTITVTKELHDQFGSVVRIAPDALSYNSSGAWRDIYNTRPNKGQIQKDMKRFPDFEPGRENIMVSDDVDHSRIRKLLAHAFSESALREQEPLINHYFEFLIQRLNDQICSSDRSTVLDIGPWFNFLTFDIIADLCFGESFRALEKADYTEWVAKILFGVKFYRFFVIGEEYSLIGWPLRLFGKIPAVRRQQKATWDLPKEKTQHRLDKGELPQPPSATLTLRLRLPYLNKLDGRVDFMTYIHKYNDERGMARHEIAETSVVLLAAGSETTAPTLSGCIYFLLKNPETMESLEKEVMSTFKSPQEMNTSNIAQLPYLNAVLMETLRMYPAAAGIFARRTGDDGAIVDERYVPPGISLGVHQWAANYSSKNFARPEEFLPERWLSDPPQEFKHDDRAAMQAFSTGPRNCLGKNLAWLELRAVIARLILAFDMSLCADSENWIDQVNYMLWERSALNVKLTKRDHVRY